MPILQHSRHFAILVREVGYLSQRTLLSGAQKSCVTLLNKMSMTTNTTKSEVSVQTFPQKASLVDEIVAIEVTGLRPKQPITLRSYFNDEDKQFESYAHYTSDANGRIDTTRHPSQGGRFSGTEPMGLFWSMVACPGARFGTRYMKQDVTKPLVVDISAHDSHLSDDQVRSDSLPLATTSIERWYMSPEVERIPVNGQKFQCTLFKPKGPGPFHAVIDMFGGVPGLIEIRGALLASRGYAALSLAYFWTRKGTQLIPANLLEMEHFEEAVDWLSSQPFIQPGGVGTIGVCKGGEMATAMAVHLPHKIRATVAISTSAAFSICPTTYKGVSFPHIEFSPFETAHTKGFSYTEEGHIYLNDIFNGQGSEDNLFQKFDKIRCPALVMWGEGDNCIPQHHGKKIAELIQNNGHDNPCEVASYPGAGHLIEPPYAPTCHHSYQPPWGIFTWGGNQQDHAHACESSWKKILDFLHKHMKGNSQKCKL